MNVAFYRLIAYSSTVLNGRHIDSPFTGELYFTDNPPDVVQDELVMHYEGTELILHRCEISRRLDEVNTEEPNLSFGIEFSYATKSKEG